MARTLGLLTRPTGENMEIVLQSLRIGTSVNKTAEAYSETGQCTDEAAISKKTTLSGDGFINGAFTMEAGATITCNEKTFLLDSVEKQSESGTYQRVSISAHRTDNANPTAYPADVPAGGG